MVVLDFHATEFSVDLLEIEAARIKLAAEPVEHLLVFFVLGIVDSLQEFVVAPDPAAVFRRTGVLSIQANRILLFGVTSRTRLERIRIAIRIVDRDQGRVLAAAQALDVRSAIRLIGNSSNPGRTEAK
jgi:hypothetical protein